MFSVATSSLNTLLGGFMTTAYNYVASVLSEGGVFLFGVVMTILAIVLWLAWNKLRHIFG